MINKIMKCGKKSIAERIMYQALEAAGERAKEDPVHVFETAVRNVMPTLEVRPRRVGGATYQIPLEVRPGRRLSLAMRWILTAARAGHRTCGGLPGAGYRYQAPRRYAPHG